MLINVLDEDILDTIQNQLFDAIERNIIIYDDAAPVGTITPRLIKLVEEFIKSQTDQEIIKDEAFHTIIISKKCGLPRTWFNTTYQIDPKYNIQKISRNSYSAIHKFMDNNGCIPVAMGNDQFWVLFLSKDKIYLGSC